MRSFDQNEGVDARAVANLILDNFDPESYGVSNLKLNKLLYYAHGFHSARFTQRLIRNHIEAWDNGPVIKVIYDCFKKYGKSYIQDRATYFDYLENKEVVASYDQLTKQQIEFVIKIVSYYIRFSAGQLVAMTHQDGSPWQRAFQNADGDARLRNRIPDEWIKDFFVDNFGLRHGH